MIIDISKYEPKTRDTFLFDTNVWIYILNPRGNEEKDRQREYSAFYKRVKNNEIFFASHIISEYVNWALRDDFNLKKKSKGWDGRDFKKKYRNTKDYKETLKSIKYTIKKPMLERCQKLDDRLSKDQLIGIVEAVSYNLNIDFNDKLSIELVKGQNIKIVTHDLDFKDFGEDVDILTAHKRFWN